MAILTFPFYPIAVIAAPQAGFNTMSRTNQRLFGSIACSLLIVACYAAGVQAQYGSPDVSRLGLEPVWSKAVLTGIRGKVSGVTVHVSPTKSYSATEVTDRFGRSSYFSGRELGTSRGGYDQMSRMAELRAAELSARGLGPQTEIKQIPEVTLYVRSDFGTVTAIDAETGREKWTTSAGTAGYPSYGVAASDEYVAVVSSTTLYLLDAESGEVLESLGFDFLPSGTPLIDGHTLYLPTRKGMVQARSTEDLHKIEFTLGSSGAITSPITLGEKTVSWTTSRGKVGVAMIGDNTSFHFQASDKIIAAPAYANGKVFVASLDGFVYGLDEETGDTLWNFPAGGPIREKPLAADGNVFVTTEDGQAISINADTGEQNWSASGIDRIVAASGSRLYCLTSDRQLAAVDVATGGRIASTSIRGTGTAAVNPNTDRVYLVGNNGVISCLRERGQRWPIARMPVRIAVAAEEPQEEAKPAVAETVDNTPSAEMEDSGGMDDGDAFAEEEADNTDDSFDDDEDPFADGFGDDGSDVVDDMGDDDPFGDEDPFQ